MKKTIFLPGVSILAIVGCHTPPSPGIEIRTVEVPTPVPCLAKDKIPVEPAPISDKLTGNPTEDLPVVVAHSLELLIWGRKEHAALEACAS